MAKLKEVCTFYSGTGFPTKYQGNDEGEYAFYKVGDIANNVQLGNKYLSVCNNYISGEVAKEIKGCILPKDTVVFAKIGEAVKLNRRAITSADCLIDNNAMGLAPIQDKLRLDYFFYYMRNLKMEKLAESTTVPSVRKSLLEELEIKVPSLEEQKEIGEILDKVSVVIQTRKQEIEQLDLLIKARFVELFGTEQEFDRWSCCTIGDVAEVYVGVVIKPTQYYTEVGVPAFRSLNIGEMKVKDNDWVYFTEEGHKKNQKSVVRTNDVLVVRSGTPGIACVVTEKYNGYNAVDIIIAHPNQDKVNSVFLAAFTNMPHGMNQIKSGTGGAAQKHFNVGGYKAMTLIIPPIELQNQFADFVRAVDKSKVAVQKALDETQILFDSLMQKYFG